MYRWSCFSFESPIIYLPVGFFSGLSYPLIDQFGLLIEELPDESQGVIHPL